jgi:hypothetical protein
MSPGPRISGHRVRLALRKHRWLDKAVPEDWSFLEWILLQYQEHERFLLLTGSDHKLRTERDPPAGKSMLLWDLMTHYTCGCMLILRPRVGGCSQCFGAPHSGHHFHHHCQKPPIFV